ncbi:MAG: acyl carrier protein [Phycisphaerales bacterium]|nr:acyl carrier protein [Phycisphaerales bacterium]
MTREEIQAKVQDVLAEVLGIDEDEVTPRATLTGDLGAESIDFLDIVFRLEQAFDVKIAQGELFPDNAAQNPEYVQDGKITAKGLEEMKAKMPHVDFSGFEQDPQLAKIGSIFTVDALVNFVEQKLAREAATA